MSFSKAVHIYFILVALALPGTLRSEAGSATTPQSEAPTSGETQQGKPAAETGVEYLVAFREELTQEARKKIWDRMGVQEVSRVTKASPLYLVSCSSKTAFEELSKRAAKEKAVRYIEPNMQYAVPTPVKPEI